VQTVRLAHDDGLGLQAAVRAGCRAAASWTPATGVAVVPADLPCLLAADVTRVLASGQAADGTFVPDHVASGTTVLMCAQGHTVLTQYGPSSAAKHRALGLRCLDDAPARARHDVDTVEDLQMATPSASGARPLPCKRPCTDPERWTSTRAKPRDPPSQLG